MDCESSGKNGQVKIYAGERSETERDAEEVQSFHEQGIYDTVTRLKELQGYKGELVLTL